MKTDNLKWGSFRVTEDDSKELNWGSEVGHCVKGSWIDLQEASSTADVSGGRVVWEVSREAGEGVRRGSVGRDGGRFNPGFSCWLETTCRHYELT